MAAEEKKKKCSDDLRETSSVHADSPNGTLPDGRRQHVIVVTPPLAHALSMSNAKDGSTRLRRLLRHKIQEACAELHRPLVAGVPPMPTSPVASSPSQITVLLILDHMECYLRQDEACAYVSDSARGRDAAGTEGEKDEGTIGTLYPAFVADLYTVLRNSPPLFTQTECATLGLARLVLVALFTGELEDVIPIVRHRFFDFAVDVPTPTEEERLRFFSAYCKDTHSPPLSKSCLSRQLAGALALRTGGVSYGGLQEIVGYAVDNYAANSQLSSLSTDTDESDAHVTAAAAQAILQAYRSCGSVTALQYRRSAGYADIQTTRWDDIAGMAEVKATLQRVVARPLHHRALYHRFGVHPSTGVLLYGPPGTGKTMLARAMATELNASFVYIDLPELVQSEVGESERRLQEYFNIARERSPSVVFMDEVQAAFGLRYTDAQGSLKQQGIPSLSGVGTAGGSAENGSWGRLSTAHDARLVSHLLHLLDAVQQDEEHFVLFVGATNVVHLLDPLLLRAGRLDTLLEVPLPDKAARENLVRRVVCGEWAAWLGEPLKSALSPNANTDARLSATSWSSAVGETTQAHRLRSALVDEFVRRSEGFSGAQVRNFTSVFGMQLARIASRTLKIQEERQRGEQSSVLDADDTDVELSTVRQERLRNVIRGYLQGDSATGNALSLRALQLMDFSHSRCCAG